MQSYLYLNQERIKGIFTQVNKGIQTKKNSEKLESFEGSISGGILNFLKSSAKGSKGEKTVIETIETSENMVATLVKIIPEIGFTKLLVEVEDWNQIEQGSLIVFRGDLEFDSYGLSKKELWDASYEDLGGRKLRHDLRLKGSLAGKLVEVPFSSNWVTGASQFSMLCHAKFGHLEGLAVVMGSPEVEPVLLQPLAFGNGFVGIEG